MYKAAQTKTKNKLDIAKSLTADCTCAAVGNVLANDWCYGQMKNLSVVGTSPLLQICKRERTRDVMKIIVPSAICFSLSKLVYVCMYVCA